VLKLISLKNSGAFTLAEVMVAILVMMIGMIGLLETIDQSLQHNLRNQLRETALQVGEKYMAELSAKGFDTISTSYAVVNATRNIRGSTANYSVERSSQVLATDEAATPSSKQLTVVVKWGFKGLSSQNRVISVVTP
jgi:type IV pilus assembly protein PilV